jgi:hypothetical protein
MSHCNLLTISGTRFRDEPNLFLAGILLIPFTFLSAESPKTKKQK